MALQPHFRPVPTASPAMRGGQPGGLALDWRYADEGDVETLAGINVAANDGMALAVWAELARGGESPWSVGLRRQRERIAARAWIVRDDAFGCAAAMNVYPIRTSREIGDVPWGGAPAQIVPLLSLEAEAPGTLHINILGTLERARRKGHASRLLAIAEELASAAGLAGTSLVVLDTSGSARALYAQHGYQEHARAAVVATGWTTQATHWILMTKDLQP